MEPTAENMGHLVGFLSQTVSADPAARKAAEAQLSAAKVQQGYALLLLRVVVAAEAPPEVRLQGAIQLKNIINQHWQSSEIHDYHLSDMDKASVKSEIVAGSMSVPEKLQPFLSEALSTICNADFPIDRNWPQLLPQLMHSLESPDPSVIVAALKVVHAISQKYVTASHTDELWAEIKAVLELHDRLLHVYGNCLSAIQANAANRQILDVLFQTITLLANIFHDLNYQDIPEVFEDALDHWMQGFHSMLTLPDSVKALFPHQDGEQMTSMHNMQRSICEALLLYADKYIVVVEDSDRSAKPDERIVFQKHLQIFVEAVWGLLTNLGVQAEFDQLAAAAIQFLASVLKGTHHSFFQQAHLQSIVTNVVVPGLNIRESDEEDFEDNPLEYMQRDLEGGTTDTRRGVTCSLVNAMCKHFEAATSQLCMAEIESALSKSDWKSKDAAIYLFIALAVKAETRAGGVQVINPAVNVIEFFQKAVLPDLQVVTAANVSKKPILLADLLKFVLVFRNQLPKEAYAVLFPILNTMLTSTDCIVHTYAASCVEKFLTVKDGTAPRVSRADLQPMLQALLTNLFNCFSNEASKENPHIMKTVMRVVNVAQGDAVAVGPMLVGKLTAMLGEFCRAFAQGISPKNPAFHHYIFETLAAISKHICATGDPAAVTTMEGLILPPFQLVMQQDITEFQPYFVQLVAQLLERRGDPIPDSYLQLIPQLLQQSLWVSKANQPALTRLIRAYIKRCAAAIVGNQPLFHQILGLVQFLMMSKMTDHNAFAILNSILCHVPASKFPEFLPVLTNAALDRLQKLPEKSNGKFLRCLLVFFSLFIAKHGPDMLLNQLESVQAGLLEQFLTHVWAPKLALVVTDATDKKICQVGLCRLLCECPKAWTFGCWGDAMSAACKTLQSRGGIQMSGANAAEDDIDFDFLVSFNNTSYMALVNAAQEKSETDPLPDVPDAGRFLVEHLQRTALQAPQLAPVINQLAQQYQLS